MSGLNQVEDEMDAFQIKVLSRWLQSQLKTSFKNKNINITKDLSSGVILIELDEVLTKKKQPMAWNKNSERNVDMVQNCDLAIDMFKNDGVQIIEISGKDINDNNQKLILGLLWSQVM